LEDNRAGETKSRRFVAAILPLDLFRDRPARDRSAATLRMIPRRGGFSSTNGAIPMASLERQRGARGFE